MTRVTRRDVLKALGAGSTLPMVACGGTTPHDDGLPVWSWDGPQGPPTTFEHGVASGDPHADSVLLWTRVSRGALAAAFDAVEVFVEVSRDATFTQRIAAFVATTDGTTDHCLTVEATELPAGTTLFYRFSALGRTSPVGRTRTLPDGPTERIRIGACSCSNFAFGYFYAYGHLAERDDVDVVLHLGDYVYEYANDGFGRTYGTFRDHEPDQEMVLLDDYRARYASYRRDPDLQELHRQHPMIHIWDDHEFANDPYIGGADNHNEGKEGAWSARVVAALQAYREWMPTRLTNDNEIYRSFTFGDLAHLVMLDRQRRFLWPEDGDDHYLGARQSAWLSDQLRQTTQPWVLLGQGTAFGPRDKAGGGGASWDPESRQDVLNDVARGDAEELVVLTGDIHKFDALDIVSEPDLYDGTGSGSAGVELAVGSVTSPGFPSPTIEIPQFHWSDGLHRGYMLIDLQSDRLDAEAWGFFDVYKQDEERPDFTLLASFTCERGSHHLERTDT
ncbi:MAG: alkaline phosphatase D family protein [Myxococcota bacterium]